jgi:hypothetical protein
MSASRIHRATKKASNQGRSQSPRNGVSRTAPGRRPSRGAAQALPLLIQEPIGSGLRFSGKQELDAHASFKLFSWPLLRPLFFLVVYVRHGSNGRLRRRSHRRPPIVARRERTRNYFNPKAFRHAIVPDLPQNGLEFSLGVRRFSLCLKVQAKAPGVGQAIARRDYAARFLPRSTRPRDIPYLKHHARPPVEYSMAFSWRAEAAAKISWFSVKWNSVFAGLAG